MGNCPGVGSVLVGDVGLPQLGSHLFSLADPWFYFVDIPEYLSTIFESVQCLVFRREL